MHCLVTVKVSVAGRPVPSEKWKSTPGFCRAASLLASYYATKLGRAIMGEVASPSPMKHLTLYRSGVFLVVLLLLIDFKEASDAATANFTFNGFSGDAGKSLVLDGLATITSSGLLELTNNTAQRKGHAFYSVPLDFKQPVAGAPGNATSAVPSFSTTFAFAIVSQFAGVLSGHGIAFLLSPSTNFTSAIASQYLGLFNEGNNGNSTNHVLAVELDTIQSTEFKDIDNNHVGIDINGLASNISHTAGWYTGDSDSSLRNLSLISGEPMQVWVDYNGTAARLDVTMAPLGSPKPRRPLLSTAALNLSEVLTDSMYVGFSSSTGSVLVSHYILGWSFVVGGSGEAPPLDPSKLPKVPRSKSGSSGRLSKAASAFVALGTAAGLLGLVAVVVLVVRRRRKFAEVFEDWEKEYGPRRLKYKDLYVAANGFKDKELLGVGGFGRVYRGVLPAKGSGDSSSRSKNNSKKVEVAIKRVSHDSRQGIREFVAEIASMGQLRHRNLVHLLGYCRRKGELLLVYEYMPNGSLDKYLYPDDNVDAGDADTKFYLDWSTRLHIIKGVASGLVYLHEDWEKVVVHRDIKASNVLLDADMNGRLGDFGLARLHDHGADSRTTRVVGTMGYLAPELARTGRATTAVDVYAFGAFVLEVVCGRRPIEPRADNEEWLLQDWVAEMWRKGTMMDVVDPRLRGEFVAHEVELVLKMGLLCSHPVPTARPSMRQVVQFLYGSAPLPELSANYMDAAVVAVLRSEGFDASSMSFPTSSAFSVSSDHQHHISGGR